MPFDLENEMVSSELPCKLFLGLRSLLRRKDLQTKINLYSFANEIVLEPNFAYKNQFI